MKSATYIHEFVHAFPDRLAEGTLYVSVGFGTAAHRCFCGCGQEVYTRFSPRDWVMTFDGETVSLKPSIGNWSFRCQSHYWLDRGRVLWADQWSRERIEAGRSIDRDRKARQYGATTELPTEPISGAAKPAGAVNRFLSWLIGR